MLYNYAMNQQVSVWDKLYSILRFYCIFSTSVQLVMSLFKSGRTFTFISM